jgi:hypothetical protein
VRKRLLTGSPRWAFFQRIFRLPTVRRRMKCGE